MDSDDSRDGAAGDGSSDGEGGAGSDSRPKNDKSGRQFDPRSPDSADGPESPDESAPGSYGSARNSEPESDDSPERPPEDESGNAGPAGPSSPDSSDYRPASPRDESPADENSRNFYKKRSPRSPKSDSRNSTSPNSTPKRNVSPPDSPPRSPPDSPPDSPKKSDARSDSSGSSRESTPRKRSQYNNPPTEEISEGDMEFEHEEKSREKSGTGAKVHKEKKSDNNMDISHEDLSDVSDLESMGPASEDDCRTTRKNFNSGADLSNGQESSKDVKMENKTNEGAEENEVTSVVKLTNGNSDSLKYDKDKSNKNEVAEEQLDFEAEEGECLDAPSILKSKIENNDTAQNEKDKNDDEGSGAASSLEDGELTDDEERRPEETEPRPVCRFYSRGLCTWGVSCRFLHPGVTDKGNYTMFDMVRTMPPTGYNQHYQAQVYPHVPSVGVHHPAPAAVRVEPPLAESAWERGLRTAKEMLRKACKRKEQDTDFEEKKMNLSLSGGAGRGPSMGPEDEDDPDLAAYAGFAPPSSPPPVRREREEYPRVVERRPPGYDDPVRGYNYHDRYEKVVRASVSPPPRGVTSHVYEDRLDDRGAIHKRRNRTTREVIVQRASGGGRGDEWADPWMRGSGNRSPTGRRDRDKQRKRKRGYSSGSSCSSSSSSRSSSRSSNSSRSGSAGRRKRRRAVSPGKPRRGALSPSIIVQERRAANARAIAMNPPAPTSRKRAPSPAATRQNAANPPAPHSKSTVDEFGRTRPKARQKKVYSKSSSSGSDSSSSSSDSDSDSRSSSSSDSSRGRPKTAHRSSGLGSGAGGLDKKAPVKISSGTRMLSPKYIADAQKKEAAELARKEAALKKRPATSPSAEAAPAKKTVSRREELLKQLKAVEEAIARKRSKT